MLVKEPGRLKRIQVHIKQSFVAALFALSSLILFPYEARASDVTAVFQESGDSYDFSIDGDELFHIDNLVGNTEYEATIRFRNTSKRSVKLYLAKTEELTDNTGTYKASYMRIHQQGYDDNTNLYDGPLADSDFGVILKPGQSFIAEFYYRYSEGLIRLPDNSVMGETMKWRYTFVVEADYTDGLDVPNKAEPYQGNGNVSSGSSSSGGKDGNDSSSGNGKSSSGGEDSGTGGSSSGSVTGTISNPGINGNGNASGTGNGSGTGSRNGNGNSTDNSPVEIGSDENGNTVIIFHDVQTDDSGKLNYWMFIMTVSGTVLTIFIKKRGSKQVGKGN